MIAASVEEKRTFFLLFPTRMDYFYQPTVLAFARWHVRVASFIIRLIVHVVHNISLWGPIKTHCWLFFPNGELFSFVSQEILFHKSGKDTICDMAFISDMLLLSKASVKWQTCCCRPKMNSCMKPESGRHLKREAGTEWARQSTWWTLQQSGTEWK